MGFRINTNLSSLRARRALSGRTAELNRNFSRLGSGNRLSSDDASAVGRSSRLGAEARSLSTVVRNAQSGIDSAKRADGQLAEVNDNLSRLRELAVAGSNGVLSDVDREALNAEFAALVDEIDRVATEDAGDEGITLDGGDAVEIQTGTNAGESVQSPEVDVTAKGLKLDSVDLSDPASAGAALETVHSAADSVSKARSELGNFSRTLSQRQSAAARSQQSHLSAEGRITSVDAAIEAAKLVQNQLLSHSSIASLLQANVGPGEALRLLG